jgi:L-methionine (R)-S-oxide reductase
MEGDAVPHRRAAGSDSPAPDRAREEIVRELQSVLDGERDPVLGMATVVSVLKESHPGWIWVGFYRVLGRELLVGPYQGRLGCMRIPIGKGVCGHCVETGEPALVGDVKDFPGHITCDPRARSEMVVPVRDREGEIRAVMDVDSDRPDGFGDRDLALAQEVARMLSVFDW